MKEKGRLTIYVSFRDGLIELLDNHLLEPEAYVRADPEVTWVL